MFDPMDLMKANELLMNYQKFYLENEERFAALARVQQTFLKLAPMMMPPPALLAMNVVKPMFEALWFRGLADTHEHNDHFLDWVGRQRQWQEQISALMPRPPI